MAHKKYYVDCLEGIKFANRLDMKDWIGGIGGIIIYDINDTAILCQDYKYENSTIVTMIGEPDRIKETKSMLEEKTNLKLEERDFSVISR